MNFFFITSGPGVERVFFEIVICLIGGIIFNSIEVHNSYWYTKVKKGNFIDLSGHNFK